MTFITWEHGLADILGPQNHTREEAGCYITCRLGRFLHSTALQWSDSSSPFISRMPVTSLSSPVTSVITYTYIDTHHHQH